MPDWVSQNIAWMYWTTPSAVFFIGLALTLVVMGVWEGRSSSVPRQGFLPIATTRGDRLFIVIMTGIGLHLVYLAIITATPVYTTPLSTALLWPPAILSVIAAALIAWRG